MAVLRYARRAEADLDGISIYSQEMYGVERADRYLAELRICCERLAESPLLGRPYDISPHHLRRLEHGKHVIFYKLKNNGVLVVRILHQRMLPENQRLS